MGSDAVRMQLKLHMERLHTRYVGNEEGMGRENTRTIYATHGEIYAPYGTILW